jgi:hypothetical protein
MSTIAPPALTQSWSNVPDYMAPDEFLRLASFLGGAAPSSRPTTHIMHSMNWVQCVKGACFIDYCLRDDRQVRQASQMLLGVIVSEHRSAFAQRCMIGPQALQRAFKEGKELIAQLYTRHGWDHDLLFNPPVDTCKNIMDLALYDRHHMVGSVVWDQRTA